MAVEIASAFVSLIPSFRDGGKRIADELDKPAEQAGKQAGKKSGKTFGGAFGSAIKKLAAPLTAAFAGIGIGAFVASTVGDLRAMESAIITGTGASGAALAGLSADATRVGARTAASFATIGAAVAEMNTATGAAGPPLQDMVRQVLNASRVLGEDGTENATAFGRAIRSWQAPAADGAKIADALFVATQAYGVGLNALSAQLTTYGPVLKNANFTMIESADLFGQLTKSGIEVSRIMPGLNAAFRRWAAEGKNSRTELERVVATIRDTADGQKALALASETFGAEGAQRLTTAIKNGSFELDNLGDALADSAGAIADTEKRTRTFSDQWMILKNQVIGPLTPIVLQLMQALIDGMGWINTNAIPALKTFAGWWQENQKVILTITKVIVGIFLPSLIRLGVVATISAAKTAAAWLVTQAAAIRAAVVHSAQTVIMVGRWIWMAGVATVQAARIAAAWLTVQTGALRAAAATKAAALGTATKAMLVHAKAVTAAGVAYVRMGVAATASAARTVAAKTAMLAVAAATKVWTAATWLLGAAQKFALGPIGLIIIGIAALVAGIIWAYKNSDTFRAIVQASFKAVGAAAMWLWEHAIKPLWAGIQVGFKLVVAAAKLWWAAVKKQFQLVADIAMWLKDRIMRGFHAWKAIFDRARAFVAALVARVKADFMRLVDFVKSIPGRIRSGLSGLKRALMAPFRAAFNAVAGLWNRSLGQFSFSVPGWVPSVGGRGWSFPKIPQLAAGAIVRAQPGGVLANIAEGGQDEVVSPLSTLRDILGDRMVQVLVDGTGLPRALAEWLRKSVRVKGVGGSVDSAYGSV